jgi:protein-S-isoprenylcysteine O-methyltransferase Ste14
VNIAPDGENLRRRVNLIHSAARGCFLKPRAADWLLAALRRRGKCRMSNLSTKAWLGVVCLALVMALLLFVPAGTLGYWQAWGYLAVFFGACSAITLYLIRNDPALLRRRLSGGPTAEKQTLQRIIMTFASIGFVALLIVPALDHRFGWSSVPTYLVIGGDLLTLAGFTIVFLAYKENSFTSATIEVAADHRVITTGPYAVVRHPMYAGSFLYLVVMPLALGSWWGFLALAAMIPFVVWRMFDEERFLCDKLPGYKEYCSRTRWRLIPGIF